MLLLDILYGAGLAAAAPYLALRTLLDRRYRIRLMERFGGGIPTAPGSSPRIWIHGASAGELLAVRSLCRMILESRPDAAFLFTTMTYTGLKAGERAFPDSRVTYLPLDLGPVIRRALDRFRPQLIILAEGDIWPNFICSARARGARIVVVNGTFSPTSVARYRHLRYFFGPAFASIDLFCLRDASQKENLARLNLPEQQLKVTGNIKYDNLATAPNEDRTRAAAILQTGSDDKVVVGGSTHEGEETPLLELCAERGDFRLVLAPRYPHRAGDIERLAGAVGLSVLRTSKAVGGRFSVSRDVIIVDTIGDLAGFYQMATAAFVGGSLVPRGGQNMLEPAALGVPVIVGPHTFSFEEDVARLRDAQAIIEVSSPEDLKDQVSRILDDPRKGRDPGLRAAEAILAMQGASGVTFDILLGFSAF